MFDTPGDVAEPLKRDLVAAFKLSKSDRPGEALQLLDRAAGFVGKTRDQIRDTIAAWPKELNFNEYIVGSEQIRTAGGGHGFKLTMGGEQVPLRAYGKDGLHDLFVVRSECLGQCVAQARHRFDGLPDLAIDNLWVVFQVLDTEPDLWVLAAKPLLSFNIELAIRAYSLTLETFPNNAFAIDTVGKMCGNYRRAFPPDHPLLCTWVEAFGRYEHQHVTSAGIGLRTYSSEDG